MTEKWEYKQLRSVTRFTQMKRMRKEIKFNTSLKWHTKKLENFSTEESIQVSTKRHQALKG